MSVLFRKAFVSAILLLPLTFLLQADISAQSLAEKSTTELIRSKAQYDYKGFIIDKLKSRRIVMLADQGHGQYTYLKTVTDFLNHWADRVKEDLKENKTSEYPSKLYLVLECDSVQIDKIYKYFKSGNAYDVIDLINLVGYQFTSAMVEFYYNLSMIDKKVEAINKELPEGRKIMFRLFGPEKVLDLSEWTTEKRDMYFVKERDEYSSQKVIDLLEKDRDAKALIFYGGAHLATAKMQKLPNIKEPGYYMAYYLGSHFKDQGGIYRIDQISADKNPYFNPVYKISDKNYAIENSAFDGNPVPNDFFVSFNDGTLVLFDKNVTMKHISRVWSDNIIDCILNNAGKFTNLKIDLHRASLFSGLSYLSLIAGKEPDNITDSASISSALTKWKTWRAEQRKENFADITYNQSITKNVLNQFAASKSPLAARFEYELSQLIKAKVWNFGNTPPATAAEYYKKYLQQNSKQLIVEDLINLLWIGTEAEKIKAAEYLKKETGEDFETAEQWTDWWRKNPL